ncbi:MAG TPA: ABC transporter permease [Clostridia bacterium]|nr:ABC transporter permease [Clostridia bacterium]
MKLFRSIGRELTLLSRSYYFYVEVAMAALYLVLLLVVMPENMSVRSTEYYFFDMPQATYEQLEERLFPDDSIVKTDAVIKVRGEDVEAVHYGTDTKDIYVIDNVDSLITLCEDSGNIGLALSLDGTRLSYRYYLQGYETEQFKNLAALLSSSDLMEAVGSAQGQTVKSLAESSAPLTDRQNLLSILLVVNCALMGIFIMAAYIFEDKKTNMINATRVTPTPVSHYLIAKMSAVLLTSIVSAMVVAIPIMGIRANYPLLALVILSAGFFTIAAGALLASFYKDMEGAFAAVFIALIVLLVPTLSHMIPTWNALWLRFIPSFWAIEGAQNALMGAGAGSTLLYCGGFLLGGVLLFLLSLYRYQHKEASGI